MYLKLFYSIKNCLWWLVEQWLFPLRRQQIFTEKVGIPTLIAVILFVGVFYSLPGYFAFTNPNPISYGTIAIALPHLQRISDKEKAMSAKYPEFAAYQQNSTRLLPWIW